MGALAKNIVNGAMQAGMSKKMMYTCRDSREAAQLLHRIAKPRDVVLIKGSRAMKMEHVIECFTNFSIH